MSRRDATGGHPPVDVVYLWVDGSDRRWRTRRQRAFGDWRARHPADLAVHGNVAGRYRDNGELRFNLRALERFFPDHGHVWIVTDAQVPAWLVATAGVTVVDHRDLIPAAALPVFDSGHIESYVHHIPGLAERYFYLNDDIFFGAPVDVAAWFGDKVTIAMEAQPIASHTELQPTETALVNASVLSANWLARTYPGYVHDWHLFSHAPRPFLRSAMLELEHLATDLFRDVRSTTFRSWRVPPLVSDLALRWMVHTGIANCVTLDPLYLCTGDEAAAAQFRELRSRFGWLPFFCINDTCDHAPADDPRLLRVASALEAILPTLSRFERQPDRVPFRLVNGSNMLAA